MSEKTRGANRSIILRRALLTAAVLLVAALFMAPVAAADPSVWDGSSVDTSWYTDAIASDPNAKEFTIDTAAKLAGLAKLVNEDGNTFTGMIINLGADIDLGDYGWPGIGVYEKKPSEITNPFSGTFNGNGKTISGMTFADNTGKSYAAGDPNNYRGFFNQLVNAKVTGLTVSGNGFGNAALSGEYGGAMIAGHAYKSTIENCVAEGSITGTHNVAGIVVRTNDATITRCTNKAELTGSYNKLGGIVCFDQNCEVGSTIENCVNEGTIKSTTDDFTSTSVHGGVGGIIGWVGYNEFGGDEPIIIKNCENKGPITATDDKTPVGQIAGQIWIQPKDISGNKGSTATLAVDHIYPVSGLNFATVTDDVAAYSDTIAAGGTYLVTANHAKPVIELALGESITFDTSLFDTPQNAIDDTGITPSSSLGLTKTENGKLVTYTGKAIASVGDNYYATLQEAITAAGAGETVTLLEDTEESGIQVASDDDVILDLNGKTLTGYIFSRGTLTVKDGTIVSNVFESCIESNGESASLTVEKVTATSKKHALRVDGGSAEIISGTYTTVGSEGETETVHALNVGSNAYSSTEVTIKGGTFNGLGENAENPDSSAAINAQSGATVTVKEGFFFDGQNNLLDTTSGGTIILYGGTYDQNPSAYVADGYKEFEKDDGIWRVNKVWTITWLNESTTLYMETIEAGEIPEYDESRGGAPIKEAVGYTYRHIGWTPEIAEAADDAIYKAVFEETPNQYRITYETNGGTNPSNAPGTHTYGTATTLPTPVKESNVFKGWYTTSNFEGEPVTVLGATAYTANINLYAKWEYYERYLVTFNAAGGTVTPESVYTDQTNKLTGNLPTPTYSGYTFLGWFTAENGGEQVTADTVYTQDTTIYAHWEKREEPTPKPSEPKGSSIWLTGTDPVVPPTETQPTETPTQTETPIEPSGDDDNDGGIPPAALIGGGAAVLIIAGLGAFAVFRRR